MRRNTLPITGACSSRASTLALGSARAWQASWVSWTRPCKRASLTGQRWSESMLRSTFQRSLRFSSVSIWLFGTDSASTSSSSWNGTCDTRWIIANSGKSLPSSSSSCPSSSGSASWIRSHRELLQPLFLLHGSSLSSPFSSIQSRSFSQNHGSGSFAASFASSPAECCQAQATRSSSATSS